MLLTSTAVSDHRLCAREAQSSSQHHHRGDGIFLGAGIVAAATACEGSKPNSILLRTRAMARGAMSGRKIDRQPIVFSIGAARPIIATTIPSSARVVVSV